MRPFFVGLFFVVFHCFFRIDACTLGNNGGNVVLMSNDTFYDGTVGDNTTLFFMTNFTQGPDLFLAVDLIGYLTSNETQNPTVVQMNIVDDDNHAIGIMTTDIPPGISTNERRKFFCLDNEQQGLCFYPYGTPGLQFSVRAFVMDPRLQDNVPVSSFLGSNPHYWFHDFTSDQFESFSQVEITVTAESQENYLATLAAVNHSSCTDVVNDLAPNRFQLTWSTRATMILPMYLISEGAVENQSRWYFRLLCLDCAQDRKQYNITLALRPMQTYWAPFLLVVLVPFVGGLILMTVSLFCIICSQNKKWGDFYDVSKNATQQDQNEGTTDERKESFCKKHAFFCVTVLLAIFFLVPVVQVAVASYFGQRKTGDLDMCYYNELCMFYLGPIPAVNNLMSNIPYLIIGVLLYGFLCLLRHLRLARCPGQCVRLNNLLPLHFMVPSDEVILKCIALSIFFEGICSILYHVCPSRANFQWDTAFMFFISGLSIVELYRKCCGRPHWSVPYSILALIIFFNFIGTFFDTDQALENYKWTFQLGILLIWIVVIVLLISLQKKLQPRNLKHIWKWKFGWVVLVIVGTITYITFGPFDDLAMVILFTTVAACFILMVAYGIASIRCSSCCKCCGFRCRQRCPRSAIIYWVAITFFTAISWITALYQFYFNQVTDKMKSPAESRGMNKKCLEILFNFFDDHDLWHILSGFGLLGQSLILVSLPENILDQKGDDDDSDDGDDKKIEEMQTTQSPSSPDNQL